MEYCRTTCVSKYSVTDWKERSFVGYALKIYKDRDVTGVIVKDGTTRSVLTTRIFFALPINLMRKNSIVICLIG